MSKFQQPNICPLHIRVVAPSYRSLMGGEVGLTSRWEDNEKLSTFILVVTARESTDSANSASVKLVSPSDQQIFTGDVVEGLEQLQHHIGSLQEWRRWQPAWPCIKMLAWRPDWRSCRVPWSHSPTARQSFWINLRHHRPIWGTRWGTWRKKSLEERPLIRNRTWMLIQWMY